jgi:polysaccharide biosynthesis/export protein
MKRPLTQFAALVSLTLLTTVTGALAQDAYRIRTGDTLLVEVIEDPTLNRSVLVSPDGRISLPLSGAVVAQGRTVEQVQADLAANLTPNFATTPNVFVSVQRIAEAAPSGPSQPAAPETISVFVLGEVNNPGELLVAPGTTMLQLFAQMGGFSDFAATRRIQLRRVGADGAEVIYNIDYQAIENGTSPNGRATVVDGDVVIVPQRGLFE